MYICLHQCNSDILAVETLENLLEIGLLLLYASVTFLNVIGYVLCERRKVVKQDLQGNELLMEMK